MMEKLIGQGLLPSNKVSHFNTLTQESVLYRLGHGDTAGGPQEESPQFFSGFQFSAFLLFHTDPAYCRTSYDRKEIGPLFRIFEHQVHALVAERRKGRLSGIDPWTEKEQFPPYVLHLQDPSADRGVDPVIILVVQEDVSKMMFAGYPFTQVSEYRPWTALLTLHFHLGKFFDPSVFTEHPLARPYGLPFRPWPFLEFSDEEILETLIFLPPARWSEPGKVCAAELVEAAIDPDEVTGPGLIVKLGVNGRTPPLEERRQRTPKVNGENPEEGAQGTHDAAKLKSYLRTEPISRP